MSCELIGDFSRVDGVGLEELRAAMGYFQRCVGEAAQRHAGRVVGCIGSAAFVLIGYPEAHEDDAERAVRAGLELCTARIVPGTDTDALFRCRVGIATGMAIIDDFSRGGPADLQIVGNTLNLAGQIRLSAQPCTVLIEPSTRQLIGNLFECRELGTIDTGEPLPIWQVVAANFGESRFEALRRWTRTPLVGRDEEVELLLRRWERAKTGNGQVVLISGEAGVGKSRITVELARRLRSEPHLHVRYSCSPYHQDSALFPFIVQLSQAAEFSRDDAPATKLMKLETFSTQAELPREDVAFLADLLSLPRSDRHPLPDLSPQRMRERLREALMHQLESAARRQTLVLAFEDAHWIDPSSRELLDLVIERVRSLPVLLMVTFRPEFQAPWIGQPHVTALTLNRLDRRDQMAVITQIVGGKALPDEVGAQIVDRADGVPLFVEELTKTVLESGLLREEANRYELVRALRPLVIPTNLRASLLARFDRLASVRNVAQIGAVIGREFSYSLLRAVSRLTEGELRASLDRLVASELVFQRGVPPDAIYSFKHALVHDAARSTLLRGARRQLHAKIAKALESEAPEMMDTQPEVFAQHYAEAGLVEKSVGFWQKAGERSAARSAMAEAAAQLQQGLEQLGLLPDSPERRRQELELRCALGAALRVAKGHAAPETGAAYGRAIELWQGLGSPSAFLHVPYAKSYYHMFRGEFDLAQSLDEALLRLSDQRGDAVGRFLGHFSFGRTLMLTGRFSLSRLNLEAAVGLYDSVFHSPLVHLTGFNPHVTAQTYLGIALCCLGYPEQSLAQITAAISEARRLAHPPSLAVCVATGGIPLTLVGDNAALAQWTEEMATIAIEQGFSFWRAVADYNRGWIKANNGDGSEGVSLLRSGLASFRATGAEAWTPYLFGLLAKACESVGQIEVSLTLLDEAFQIVERTGERWFEAELHRQKGELLLLKGHAEAAESLYCQALGIAIDQEAKLWQLRAAVSLAHLRRDQGRHAEARDLLAPIYGWFAEGFGTSDLKEAGALLAELR